MRAVVQRVSAAAVHLDGRVVASIDRGLVILICVEAADRDDDAAYFARKIAHMRIFADGEGRMNRSLGDIGGEALVISQFTLAADWRRGNRPTFSGAADPETAQRLYVRFGEELAKEGVPVRTGVFGGHMAVSLVNDGPVTISMNSADG